MAYTLLIFLPAAACLFWIVIHVLMASRTSTFGLYLVLLLIGLGAFFCYSCYDAPLSSWKLLDISSMLTLLFGPALIPLICGQLLPIQREIVILRYALPVLIAISEIGICEGIAHIQCFLAGEPFAVELAVLVDAAEIIGGIEIAEAELAV